MIERIISISLRNRFLVLLVAGGLFAWGIQSVRVNKIDAIPDLSENQVIVFTDWPGRSPREIEDQVTYPLTRRLQGLAGVKAEEVKPLLGRNLDGDLQFHRVDRRVNSSNRTDKPNDDASMVNPL